MRNKWLWLSAILTLALGVWLAEGIEAQVVNPPASSGTVSNITSSGGTLTVTNGAGPTANAELNLSNANTWIGAQTLQGAINAPAQDGSGTIYKVNAYSNGVGNLQQQIGMTAIAGGGMSLYSFQNQPIELGYRDSSDVFHAAFFFSSARKGTFVCTGAGTITIANANEAATSDVIISLNAQGGTITTPPAMKTVTAGTGFTVLCGATDTSTYNYDILN